MKLYEIAPALRFALDDIEVDPETGEILNADALHAVEAEAAEKIEATALYLRELDAEAKAAKDEAERILARVKSMQKRSDYLKSRLLEAVHATGKVKTARVTVSIRTTGRCRRRRRKPARGLHDRQDDRKSEQGRHQAGTARRRRGPRLQPGGAREREH